MKYLLALALSLAAAPVLAQSDDCYPGLGLCEDAVTAKTPLPSRINIGTPETDAAPLQPAEPAAPEQSQPQPQSQPQTPTGPAAQFCVVYDVRPPDAWLALRSEPTTKRGRRIYKLPSGTRLEMLGPQEGNWHLVRVSDGSVGWVSWYRDRWIAC